MISKRRESYLNHASLPFSSSQKRKLLVSPGSGMDLFVQDPLKKVSSQVEEDSFISLSLAKFVCSQSQGRGKLLAPLMLRVPLPTPCCWITRPGSSSSSGKLSSAPGRGGAGKRFMGGRGSALLRSKQGFQK